MSWSGKTKGGHMWPAVKLHRAFVFPCGEAKLLAQSLGCFNFYLSSPLTFHSSRVCDTAKSVTWWRDWWKDILYGASSPNTQTH